MLIEQLEIIVPDEAEMLEIVQMGQAGHLHLITNGQRSVLSPIVPAGWHIQLDYRSHKAQQLAKVAA